MKTTYFLLLVVLVAFLAGCTGKTASKDGLTLTKEKVCLQFDGKEQCMNAPGSYRLHLVDGKPVLEALNMKGLGDVSFEQYGRPDAIKTEKLGVIIDNKVLRLQDGEKKMMDPTGLGFLIMRDETGAISIAAGQQVDLASHAIELSSDNRIVRRELAARKLEGGIMAFTQIDYTFAGEQRVVPNDTGTIVIILDNFKVVGSCDAKAPDSCCPSGETAGPPVTVTDGMVSDHAADGLRLLTCFPVNSICTFTHGDKLIILDCATQKRYCLDLSICQVTIATTDENGICISVPSDCAIENPFN
jgi:hypothetical protein